MLVQRVRKRLLAERQELFDLLTKAARAVQCTYSPSIECVRACHAREERARRGGPVPLEHNGRVGRVIERYLEKDQRWVVKDLAAGSIVPSRPMQVNAIKVANLRLEPAGPRAPDEPQLEPEPEPELGTEADVLRQGRNIQIEQTKCRATIAIC